MHFHAFLAGGFRDHNRDHLCPVRGEPHPLWFSDEYQRRRAAALAAGNIEYVTDNGGDSANEQQLVVSQGPQNHQQLVVVRQHHNTVTHVVPEGEAKLAKHNTKVYVTDCHVFPRIDYFDEIQGRYPGVDHLPSCGTAASASPSAVHSTGFGRDQLLRVALDSGYAYTFADVVSSQGPCAEADPNAADAIDDDRSLDYRLKLHARYWGLCLANFRRPGAPTSPEYPVPDDVPMRPTNTITVDIPLIDPNLRKGFLCAYANEVARFLVDTENSRWAKWRHRVDDIVSPDEEPPSDVYAGVLPSERDLHAVVFPRFLEEATALANEWVRLASEAHDYALNKGGCEANGPATLAAFYARYFVPFLEAVVAFERARRINARIGGARRACTAPWNSAAGPSGAQHAIPAFLTARIRGPCNTVLDPWLAACAFEVAPGRREYLTTACDSSFDASSGSHGKHSNELMARLASTYFVGGIRSTLFDDLTTDPPKKVMKPASLTIDALRVLSRVYCSACEDAARRHDFLDRPYPTVNFVVVQRERRSPFPDHLRVVLHSDPRGLSLARGLVPLRDHLPTAADGLTSAQVVDIHALPRVAVILYERDAGGSATFRLLKAVDAAPRSLVLDLPPGDLVSHTGAFACALLFQALCEELLAQDIPSAKRPPRPRAPLLRPDSKDLLLDNAVAPRDLHTAFQPYDKNDAAMGYGPRLDRLPFDKLAAFAADRRVRVIVLVKGDSSKRLGFHSVFDGRVDVKPFEPKDTLWVLLNPETDVVRYLVPRAAQTLYDTHEAATAVQLAHKAYADAMIHRAQLALRKLAGLGRLGRALGVYPANVEVPIMISLTATVPTNVRAGPDEHVWARRLDQVLRAASPFATNAGGKWDVSRCEEHSDRVTSFFHALTSVLDQALAALQPHIDAYVASAARHVQRRDCDFAYNADLRPALDSYLHSTRYVASLGGGIFQQLLAQARFLDYKSAAVSDRFRQGAAAVREETAALQARFRQFHADHAFLDAQARLIRLFPSVDDRRRVFIAMYPSGRHPRGFRNHMALRLTDRVRAYYDPYKKAHFAWNHATKVSTRIVPLLPFWDPDLRQLCVLKRHDNYFALMAEHAALKQRIAALPEHERPPLREQEETILADAADILRLHTYAYDQARDCFVSASWHATAADRRRKASAFDPDVEEKRRACDAVRESLRRAIDASLKPEQDRLRLVEERLEQPADEGYDKLLEDKAGLERLVQEIQDRVVAPLEQQLHRLDAALAEVQAKRDAFLSDTPPPVDLGYPIRLLRDPDARRLEWRCPQNDQVYHLKEDHVAEATLLAQVQGLGVQWTRQQAMPASRDDPDTWFNPVDGSQCFLDYERAGWIMKRGEDRWTRKREAFLRYHAEVQALSMDVVAVSAERVFGFHRRDFAFQDTPVDDLIPTELRSGHDVFTVYGMPILCANASQWGADDQDLDADGEAIARNTNQGTARRRRYAANSDSDDDDDPRGRRGASARGWDDDIMDVITGKRAAKPPAPDTCLKNEYDHIRFLSVYSGEGPNGIACDFGSSGHDPAWEHPVILFRQSWLIQSPANALAQNQELRNGVPWSVPRLPFHRGLPLEALIHNPLVANPTGVHARNIERYWGYDPTGQAPKVHWSTIHCPDRTKPLRSHGRYPYVTKDVVDFRRLYQERASMFYHWIHDPRNWYWDHTTRRFCVFAYTPNMVFVQRDGAARHLVQQLAVYYVSQLYPGEAQDAYRKQTREFLMLRNEALQAWTKAEKTHPMDPALRARIDKEAASGVGFSPELLADTRKHFAAMLNRVASTRCTPYYALVRAHFISPHGAAFRDGGPPTPAALLRTLGDRQRVTRQLFWNLFEAKFGIPYHAFLTAPDARSQVLSRVPDFLGPSGADLDSNAGTAFLAAWAAAGPEASFTDFFSSLFSPQQGKPCFALHSPPDLQGIAFPLAPPDPADPGTLEDWYWAAADVLPALQPPGP